MDTKLKKFNWLRFGITAATITLLSVFALLGTTFWAKSIADANMQSYLIQNYSDELTYYSYTDNYYYQGQGYYFRQFNIGFIICILLLVCALGFGLSMIRRCGIGRGFWGRIPLELYLFVGIFVLTNMIPMFAGVCNLIMYDNLPEKLYSMFLIPYSLGVFLSYASLFISYWCTFFVAFQGAASLGAGLRDGLKSYFIKSTLVGICCAWCYRWAKKVAVRLSRVDLSSPLEKKSVSAYWVKCPVGTWCMLWTFVFSLWTCHVAGWWISCIDIQRHCIFLGIQKTFSASGKLFCGIGIHSTDGTRQPQQPHWSGFRNA